MRADLLLICVTLVTLPGCERNPPPKDSPYEAMKAYADEIKPAHAAEVKRGLEHFRRGDYRRAYASLTRYQEFHDSTRERYYRGIAAYHLGKHRTAVENLKEAYEHEPPIGLKYLIRAYYRAGKYEAALLQLLEAHKAHPRAIDAVRRDPELAGFHRHEYFREFESVLKMIHPGKTPRTKRDLLRALFSSHHEPWWAKPERRLCGYSDGGCGCLNFKIHRNGTFTFTIGAGIMFSSAAGYWRIDEKRRQLIFRHAGRISDLGYVRAHESEMLSRYMKLGRFDAHRVFVEKFKKPRTYRIPFAAIRLNGRDYRLSENDRGPHYYFTHYNRFGNGEVFKALSCPIGRKGPYYFDHYAAGGIRGLKHIRDFPFLAKNHARLEFRRSRLRDVDMQYINYFTTLRVFLPNSPHLTPAGLRRLSDLKELRELSLSHSRMGDRAIPVLKNFPALETLWADRAPVTDAGMRKLCEYASGLRTLSVPRHVTDAGLRRIAGCRKLNTLHLDGGRITWRGVSYLKGLTELKTLSLEGTKVDDRAIPHLLEIKSLVSIKLEGTRITKDGAGKLKAQVKHISTK